MRTDSTSSVLPRRIVGPWVRRRRWHGLPVPDVPALRIPALLPLQILSKPSHGLGPRILRRFGPVAGPAIAMEPVPAAWVHVELIGFAVLVQLIRNLGHVRRRRVAVLLAKQAQDGCSDVGSLLDGSRSRPTQRLEDATAVEHHRRFQVRNVAGCLVGNATAKAEPHNPYT